MQKEEHKLIAKSHWYWQQQMLLLHNCLILILILALPPARALTAENDFDFGATLSEYIGRHIWIVAKNQGILTRMSLPTFSTRAWSQWCVLCTTKVSVNWLITIRSRYWYFCWVKVINFSFDATPSLNQSLCQTDLKFD